MTVAADPGLSSSSNADRRSTPLVVWLLRLVLWPGALAALAAAGYLIWHAVHPPAPSAERSDLPDMTNAAVLAMWMVMIVAGAVTVPMLVALRRPRPWLARTALVIVTLAWAGVSTAVWKDVRGEWNCSEAELGAFVAPLWLAAIAVLAALPEGHRALGLPRGPLVLGVRFLVLGTLAGLVGGGSVCLWGCTQPADAVIAKVHVGQDRAEALALLYTVCEQTKRPPNGDMRFRCAPQGPPACACAPAPAREVTFGIGPGDRVVRLSSATVLGAMRRPR